MSNENFTDEQRNHLETNWNKEKRKEIKEFLAYLKEKYSCEFPDNFPKRLLRLGNDWVPSEKVADAIILEWLEWQPYVTQESYHSFVQHELDMLFRIHTASTFGSQQLLNFIGNKAQVVKYPPCSMSTTVKKNGELIVRGKKK